MMDFKFSEELKKGIEGILDKPINPPSSPPCRVCKSKILRTPIYHRDLGGPYCSNDCLEMARMDSLMDYIDMCSE